MTALSAEPGLDSSYRAAIIGHHAVYTHIYTPQYILAVLTHILFKTRYNAQITGTYYGFAAVFMPSLTKLLLPKKKRKKPTKLRKNCAGKIYIKKKNNLNEKEQKAHHKAEKKWFSCLMDGI